MAVNGTIDLQMNFSGTVWTSVWSDVRLANPVTLEYGIDGNGPMDRVANTGVLTFAMDNSAFNSGLKLGYYSPGNGNCRSGFEQGIGVRLSLAYGGTTAYKFVGRLSEIDPVPFQYSGERVTLCQAVDWMDEAAITKISGLEIQTGLRPDQLIGTVVANMTKQPTATNYGTAQLEYPYALDTVEDENTAPLSELVAIVQSDMGYLYVKGDTTTGGVLRFEDRRYRQTAATVTATFNDTMTGFVAPRPRRLIYNTVKVTVHPRIVDSAATTIVYDLDQTNPPAIAAGETITITGRYVDPTQQAVRFGAINIAPAVADSTYSFGTGPGDASLTANLGIVQTAGGNSATFALTNNGTQTGYVTLLRLYGRGVYDYAPLTVTATDATSKAAYGENTLTIDLPYESRVHVAKSLADFYLSVYKDPRYVVDELSFLANASATFMGYAVSCEPGDLVTVAETVTSVNANHFINGVKMTFGAGGVVGVSWRLAPDLFTGNYFILNTSTLNGAAVLGV